MCGRFTLHASPEEVAVWFGLSEPPPLAPRYNIAPTQPVGIVRRAPDGGREWSLVLWGLIPSWAKDPLIGARMINARSETAAEKPSFRAAMRRRRCLVPANGFYEWMRAGKLKQPYFIHIKDGGVMAMAGLWESWTGPDGSRIDSCTILTTEANELIAPLHDRMPVILAPEDFDDWLGEGADASVQDLDRLRHLMRPYPAEQMATYAVSRHVNNPRHEGAECIEEVTPEL